MDSSFSRAIIIAAASLAALLASACSAQLREVNHAATLNTQALGRVGAIYDAAATARIDATSRTYTSGQGVIQPVELGRDDTSNIDYRDELMELRRHAELLNTYFTSLTELTAPGSNSATSLTDTQLANAGGIASMLKKLEPNFSDTASTTVAAGLTLLADSNVRVHLREHGEDVSDALLTQIGALRIVRDNLAADRSFLCRSAQNDFERSARRPANGRGRNPMTNAEAQQFATTRRTIIGCNRHANDADAVIDALVASRLAFIALVEGDQTQSRRSDLDAEYETAAQALAPRLPSRGDTAPLSN